MFGKVQKMKKFLVENWKYFIFLPIIVALVVGLYFSLPKSNDSNEIYITASDIEAKVGDLISVNYSVSDKNAVCSLLVLDEDIAVVDDNKLLAVSEGKTKLIIEASMNNKTTSKTVDVVVSNKEEEKPNSNIDENETPLDSSEIRVVCLGNEIDYLHFLLGEFKVITINCNSAVEVSTYDSSLIIEKIEGIANTYKISSNSSGLFQIIIKSQDATKILKVFVNN